MGFLQAFWTTFANARRYSPTLSSTLRMLSVLALHPQWVDPDAGVRGFTGAIGRKLRLLPDAGKGVVA